MTAPSENKGCLPRFLLRLFGIKDESEISLPYRMRDDYLSKAEASFMNSLMLSVGNRFLICPKVSLKEFIRVSGTKKFWTFHNKIDRKHVDFLLCDLKTFKPRLGIELDDSSHKRPDRIERDKFVNGVFEVSKLSLLHIPVRHSYNIQLLENEIDQLLGYVKKESVKVFTKLSDNKANKQALSNPVCPKCEVAMILRTAKRGNNKGQQFFGCENFPKCKEIVDINPAQTT